MKQNTEQLNLNLRKECPTPVYFVNSDHKIIKKGCGNWRCSVCAKTKASRTQYRAIQGASRISGFVRMLTLTLIDSSYEKTMMKDWNNLLTQLKKQGYVTHFFWVKEFQERGVRHLHVIFWGRFTPWEIIKKYWSGSIDIRQIRGRGAHRYVMKYLGDSEKQRLFNKNERRYGYSQGFMEAAHKAKSAECENNKSSWYIIGYWQIGYSDIAFAYEQQNNDIQLYKSKWINKDNHPEYQRHLPI